MIPGFVDSHSHLLFAGDRTQEFNARMSGRPYTAGGIRTTVAATRAATDDELSANVVRYLTEALRQGTTTFETKSGYGLTVEDEARALRIAARHTDEVTYLGAHVVSPDYADDPAGYVDLVTGPMLDACAPYARWVDVFCEKGAFDGDQARAILTAGMAKGLHPRVHANQLSYGPGVQLAVELDAASADHCTHLTDADVDALAQGNTVATLLPGAEFSTRADWPDARRILDAGATVALSTDCNPGSSFTSSMPFCIALAVRDMGMTPDEALWSATAAAPRPAPHGHRPHRPRSPRRPGPPRRPQPCPPRLPAGCPAGPGRLAARRTHSLTESTTRRHHVNHAEGPARCRVRSFRMASSRNGAERAGESFLQRQALPELDQRPREQPRDVHLGDAELLTDLRLRHVGDEAEREDLPVAAGQRGDQRLQGLDVLNACESVVLVADPVGQCTLGVVFHGLGVE